MVAKGESKWLWQPGKFELDVVGAELQSLAGERLEQVLQGIQSKWRMDGSGGPLTFMLLATGALLGERDKGRTFERSLNSPVLKKCEENQENWGIFHASQSTIPGQLQSRVIQKVWRKRDE